jgi:YHS domain-containing protein
MRAFTALLAAGFIFAGAAAQHHHPVSASAKKTIACPIMAKNKVDMAKATKTKMFADYKGNRYFFCCGSCPATFKKNPAKYAKAPHIKTPKTK